MYKDYSYNSIYNWVLGLASLCWNFENAHRGIQLRKKDVKAGHPVGEKPYFLGKGSASQLMTNRSFEPGTLNTQFQMNVW